ncbi:ABC transporter permease [Pseudonocardia acaciae]|uniref:ABC transporter permease n=1 Tax=Pseudonocardia acaciae TaxID=551276 RepID=UPI0006856B32|nr:ABC transporter permease [Pseudonocardia acaciae]
MSTTQRSSGGTGRARTLTAGVERGGLILLLAALVIFFASYGESRVAFASEANIRTIIGGQVVVSLLALAALIPLVGGQFDLSVGASLGLSAIGTAAASARHGLPPAAAVMVGVAVGAAVGLVNAVAVAILELDSIIVTLATATVISGLVQWYTGGRSIAGVDPAFTGFASAGLAGVPLTGVVLAVVTLAVWHVLDHTPYGRHLHAVGANRRAAHLVGIEVRRTSFVSFLGSGITAGIGGVIATANLGAGNPSTGPDMLFAALAAVFLGATCIRPGRFNVFGTLVGVFFVAVAVSGLSLIGVDTWVQPTFNGTALLVAVGLAAALARRRR